MIEQHTTLTRHQYLDGQPERIYWQRFRINLETYEWLLSTAINSESLPVANMSNRVTVKTNVVHKTFSDEELLNLMEENTHD